MTVLPDGFALASFLSHWFKEHLSRMQSRACSCYAEAMVFFGRSPKNAVLFGKEGGIRAPWLSLVVGRRALEEDGLLVVGADADLVALVELALRVVGGNGVAAGGGLERAYGEVDAHGIVGTGDGEVAFSHELSDTLVIVRPQIRMAAIIQ